MNIILSFILNYRDNLLKSLTMMVTQEIEIMSSACFKMKYIDYTFNISFLLERYRDNTTKSTNTN